LAKIGQGRFGSGRRAFTEWQNQARPLFCTPTIEKALKAIYSKRLEKVPPKAHHLENLALKCGIALTAEQTQLLDHINTFNIEGRYEDEESVEMDAQSAKELRAKAEGVYQWLINQL
jgi:hypothetical protein